MFIGLLIAIAAPAFGDPTLTTLASFNNANGARPNGLMFDSGGNIYGTTNAGGANGLGTVFKLPADTHTVSTLATFDGTNGANPYGRLIADASGNLYGTTSGGGTAGYGTVFEFSADSHLISTLATFNGANGRLPYAGLIADTAGNMYGTTDIGGFNSHGTVFKLSTGTHELTNLHIFGADGQGPGDRLIADSAGNMYGTTLVGGPRNYGTVFKISSGSQTISTLTTFEGAGVEQPRGDLVVDAAGNIFGTSQLGGSEFGRIYELSADTHEVTILARFVGANGAIPYAGLIADADGNLYGSTIRGGVNDKGILFKWSATTHNLTTLASFNGINGDGSISSLIADATGNLYGSTFNGGTSDSGIIFELSDSGFAVPEPTSLAVLAVAASALLVRRRRTSPFNYSPPTSAPLLESPPAPRHFPPG